ncbi:MAG TPA: ABC transporter substrate-binding protein [Anaerolineae bacterium]|nr:ABC transporter substrate-binding protein [Anaerolineae bacterium]
MSREKVSTWIRLIGCFVLVAVVAGGTTGCGAVKADATGGRPTGHRATPPEGVFRLGVLGPFTGPSASTGAEFRGAVTMAFDAAGWQIGGYTVEPVWIDSQSDPASAARAYERAVVEGGIEAAILNWHSDVALECMEVAADYQIPHIFPYGATEAVNAKFRADPERYGYWMNKGWPVPATLTRAYVEAIEDAIARGAWEPMDKTAAICAENTAWGRSFGRAIKQQLQDSGWRVVSEEYFDLDEVQFYALLYGLKARDVALVAATSTSMPSFAAFINQADEVGLESLIIGDGLGWAGEWHAVTGEASNYVVDQIPVWATGEGQEFAALFEERWGVAPSPSAAGLAYDGAGMFIEIARQALAEYGELSSETIYRWASENLQTGAWSYTGGIVMEEYRYTPDTLPDPVVGQGYYLFPVQQYVDGQARIVYPPQWAEQPLQVEP